MKIIYTLTLILLSTQLQAQKCNNLKQSIDAHGNFNIFLEDKPFDKHFENIAEIIEPEEKENGYLKEFQEKFPEIYDGKCLKIKFKNSADSVFLFCDKKQKEQISPEESATFGTFQLTSIVDDYYFIKYSGFEIWGYFMYNAKDHLFYNFIGKPIVSKNKDLIYSYTNHPYLGFMLNILVLDYYRELNYSLNGKFDVKDLVLVQYKNTERYSVIINLQENIPIIDENYKILSNNYCNWKIRIN